MQKWLLTIIIAILPVITACSKTNTEVSVPEEETGKKTEIKFLQLNLWVECTKVEHAPEYLIEQIATLQPDIATFCELYKGPQDDPVMPKLMQGLKDKGLIYYDARNRRKSGHIKISDQRDRTHQQMDVQSDSGCQWETSGRLPGTFRVSLLHLLLSPGIQ